MTHYQAKWPDQAGIIAWTAKEHQTWKRLIERQKKTIQNRACVAFQDELKRLDLPTEQIPQIKDLNRKFSETGWKMVAVEGTVLVNDFFKMLSMRAFPVAHFIRIPEELDYLKQPDIFHEIFGHGPMLLNPHYADFVQWYGEMALTFSPAKQKILSRLFWYSIEFGLIKSPAGVRVFGAGILSSHQETIRSLDTAKVTHHPFDLDSILNTDYDYQNLQPHYFLLENIEQLNQIRSINDLDSRLISVHNQEQQAFINC